MTRIVLFQDLNDQSQLLYVVSWTIQFYWEELLPQESGSKSTRLFTSFYLLYL
jgi:hypothetical protein